MRWLLVIFLAATTAEASWFSEWSARPALPEPISFVSGAALTGTALALRHPLVKDFEHFEATRKPLGSVSKIADVMGQMVPNALYAGGMLIGAWVGESEDLAHAELMITASLEAALISETLKLTVREERPDSHQKTSFPSGHSTTAFAFASVVGAEHGWRWGVPAYALAAFVAWSRLNDHRHFLHDTLAGATIGVSTGLGVYLARERRTGRGDARWRLLPMPIVDATGGTGGTGGGMLLQASY